MPKLDVIKNKYAFISAFAGIIISLSSFNDELNKIKINTLFVGTHGFVENFTICDSGQPQNVLTLELKFLLLVVHT